MAAEIVDFATAFEQLTGHGPFPWQVELFRRFLSGNIPDVCDLPTGLGKTSVLAVWLLARERMPDKLPRRLVYIVNRRTVVDQTTVEAEKLMKNAEKMGITIPAISTLRGQYADNREWSADPSRPAIVCGTVDMIGSRLLFSGYGVGFKSKPLHAGFLGQDSLLVHDEAHLEPAFQQLLIAIQHEQLHGRTPDFRPLRVMELSATSRGGDKLLKLSDEDLANSTVAQRVNATKRIHLHTLVDEKKLADEIASRALTFKDKKRAVLVFVRLVEDVEKIVKKLPAGSWKQLTGTIRGKERDDLVKSPIFQRFLPDAVAEDKTVYLVATSAGEVGVNISADHLVCDLSTFDSMAQRFGRVNRFGKLTDSEIHIVHARTFDDKKELDVRRRKTLILLEQLEGDGSPGKIGTLPITDRVEAFAPPPTILPTSDILFDAWTLTSIQGKLPGRPPVEPYLHGISAWEPPQTQVAWRDEVEELEREFLDVQAKKEFEKYAVELLDDYPLKPHELLHDRSDRVFKHLVAIAERHPKKSAWLIDDAGAVTVFKLEELADKDKKERIDNRTVLLSPNVGGLDDGMLAGSSTTADDVADTQDRMRVWDDENVDAKLRGMRLIRRIDIDPKEEDDEAVSKSWFWYESPLRGDGDGSKSAKRAVLWQVHTDDVKNNATEYIAKLPMSDAMKQAVILAADCHDLGKTRALFQRILGNSNAEILLSKSGGKGNRIRETYRHEFGSLLDLECRADFHALPCHEEEQDMQELVRHMIAAHHGRARPHFPADEVFDPEPRETNVEQLAAEVPRRFARLQRKYGRWGLAYLESLLRAADYAASAEPSKFVEDGQ